MEEIVSWWWLTGLRVLGEEGETVVGWLTGLRVLGERGEGVGGWLRGLGVNLSFRLDLDFRFNSKI